MFGLWSADGDLSAHRLGGDGGSTEKVTYRVPTDRTSASRLYGFGLWHNNIFSAYWCWRKRWDDNIKEWTGLEWNIILRKAEDREE